MTVRRTYGDLRTDHDLPDWENSKMGNGTVSGASAFVFALRVVHPQGLNRKSRATETKQIRLHVIKG